MKREDVLRWRLARRRSQSSHRRVLAPRLAMALVGMLTAGCAGLEGLAQLGASTLWAATAPVPAYSLSVAAMTPPPAAPWRGDEALARDGVCLRRVDGLDRLQRVAGARLRDGHAERVAQALAQALREAGLPCREAPASGFALDAELRAHAITGRWDRTVTLTIAYRLLRLQDDVVVFAHDIETRGHAAFGRERWRYADLVGRATQDAVRSNVAAMLELLATVRVGSTME
ncbi:hypothetical protein [Azohydromonas sediminis]|uniref:hypothetical protein n=1 Tax=Azohydromonas sediminis TaxID=2259674 RepID=UPI0013C2E6DB|nr:hypothetical protein [Azohydromonas sediminis]